MRRIGEVEAVEAKRLLELVAFARRDQDRRHFTWRRGLLTALAALSFFAALRTWTTWQGFHRPIKVHSPPHISPAEQGAMIAAIRASHPWMLDPVAMNAATFQSVFLGLGRIERSVRFVRNGGGMHANVYRCDGGSYGTRLPTVWHFTFSCRGTSVKSEQETTLIH